MATSKAIADLIGPTLVALATGMLLNLGSFTTMAEQTFDSANESSLETSEAEQCAEIDEAQFFCKMFWVGLERLLLER